MSFVSCIKKLPLIPLPSTPLRRDRTISRHAFGIDVSQWEGIADPETSYRVVYSGLGVMTASFAATFFVAPNFRTALKEPDDWKNIYEELVKQKVVSVSPLEASDRLSENTVLMDVSLASKYAKQSAKGSVNFPLYQPIQGWDLASNARRAAFTFFGIPGTERNPLWLEQIESSIPKDKEIIVMCELGGSLEKKIGMDTGFQSRSLKAIYYLQKSGYNKITHLKGGINEWIRQGLPTTTDE